MPSMRRLAVLKLSGTALLYVKEPSSPVVIALSLIEPLSDTQLRHLSVAAPWNPIMVDAFVDDTLHGEGFAARIDSIDILPKLAIQQPKRRMRAGLVKRKRGYLFHD